MVFPLKSVINLWNSPALAHLFFFLSKHSKLFQQYRSNKIICYQGSQDACANKNAHVYKHYGGWGCLDCVLGCGRLLDGVLMGAGF